MAKPWDQTGSQTNSGNPKLNDASKKKRIRRMELTVQTTQK